MKISPSPLYRLLCALLFAMPVFQAAAQFQVSSIPATNRFSSQPPASQWSTHSIAGANNTVSSAATLDSAVQGVAASSINTPLTPASGSLPAAGVFAAWSSDGFVQTRASGNAATLLMVMLTNTTGGTSGVFHLRYDFLSVSPMAEEVAGHRVYYSFSGAMNTWSNLAALSGGGSGVKTAAVNFVSWPTNGLLYVVWADDNASSSDGGYQIDNFTAQFVSGPVRIAREPDSQIAAPGTSASFSVLAYGAPPLTYQWRKDNGDVAAATNATLIISNAQPADEGNYSVVVGNAFGAVTSAVASLTIGIEPLTILTQPQDTNVVVGNNVMVSISVDGSIPSYQWFKGNTALTGATNDTLLLPSAQFGDAAVYHVIVTNPVSSITSRLAIVSVVPSSFSLFGLNSLWRYNQDGFNLDTSWREVIYANETNWLQGAGVLAQEDNVSIRPLTNTVLWLTGPGGAVITYYFRKEFVLTNDPGDVMLVTSNLFDDGAVVYANGIEAYRVNMAPGTVNYSTTASNQLNEGVFVGHVIPGQLLRTGTNVLAVEVHQTSAGSSDIVMGLSAMVHYAPMTFLSITNQPQSRATDELRPVTFAIGYTGTAARVQWFRETLSGPELVPGGSTTVLTIPSPTMGVHDGNYFAVISNAVDFEVSQVATLVITQAPPTIVQHPQPKQLCAGSVLLLEVSAYGSTTSTFQWLLNDNPILNATNASYALAVTTTNDSGLYSVIVSNALGTATSSNALVEIGVLPFILAQSDGEGAGVGGTAQFHVTAGGCEPFTYQWQFNGTNILDATNATLVITNVQLANEGSYRVLVGNSKGAVASAEAPLVVSIGAALNAPELTWTMPSGLWIVEGANTHDGIASLRSTGTSAILETTVNGPARLSFWTQLTGTFVFMRFRIDGQLQLQWLAANAWGEWEFYIPAGSHVLSWESQGAMGLTNTIVFLDQITLTTNDLGPALINAPQNLTIAAGSNFFFAASAEGFPPLRYQWQLNGVDLPGANQSIFAVQNGQPLHAGNYTVIVSNEFGTATATAALSVTSSAPRMVSSSRVLAVPGRDVVLNAQARGSEPLSYQWLHDGAPIAGATNAAMVLPHGPTNWPGRYSVFVSNAFGAATGPEIEVSLSRVTSVVQISMDGLAARHLLNGFIREPDRYPAFAKLMKESAFTFNARCDYTHSITVPNHLSMILGRPVLQPAGQPETVHHGYTNNFSLVNGTIHNLGNTNVDYFASVFDVVHDRGGSTAFLASKTSLTICSLSYDATNGAPDLIAPDHGRNKIDYVQYSSSTPTLVNALLSRLNSSPDTYAFLHCAETDSVGHSAGWGSVAWFNALEQLDVQLGRVLTAIESNANPQVALQTAVIVTADHGGEDESHLDPTAPLAYTIPLFVWGPGFSGGTDLYSLFANRADPGNGLVDFDSVWQPIRNGDVGNLALGILGLPAIPGSTLLPMFPSDSVSFVFKRQGDDLVLEWPASAFGFVLETSGTIGSGSWSPVTSGVTTNVNGFRYVSPADVGAQFFRLRK